MFILYLDEFGHNGTFDPADPTRQHSPIFGLGGVLIRDSQWRDLDRGYLRLKANFFSSNIQASGERAERWEFKGTNISKPSNQKNKQNERFAHAVLALLQSLGCTIVAKGRVKPNGAAHRPVATYTSVVQGLMRAMEKCLRKMAGKKSGVGLMVIDQRNVAEDKLVISSAQSHLHATNNAGILRFQRLIESPLVVDSRYYHGVQVADIVCGILGGLLRYRHAKAHSKQYANLEPRFGGQVDSLTYTDGGWRSVWIG